MHRGKAPVGIASPAFVTGRYSKHLPTRLIEKYQAARTDGELLSVRDDIALLDARLEDLLAKVDTGETGETWKALMSAVHEFDKSERAANVCQNDKKKAEYLADREEAMRTIIVLCQAGMADYAAWSEVRTVLEQRRKTAETEHKRIVAMQQMVTNDQLIAMQSAILASIRRHVTDPVALRGLAADFNQFSAASN